MPRRLTGSAFVQEHHIRHHACAFLAEGVGRQTDCSQEIRPVGQIRADAGVLLVERVMRRDERQDAARLQRVQRFGEEEIMER
jgi:hypothetical protein